MTALRVVLAVLLSTALLGVALPAADTARSQRAATLAADEATDLAGTIDRFTRRNDAVVAGADGATRLVTVRVPAGTALRVQSGQLVWTQGDRTHPVTTDVRLVGDATLAAGRHRLRLSLHRRDGEPVVTVRRFKSEAEATASRVRSSYGPSRVPV